MAVSGGGAGILSRRLTWLSGFTPADMSLSESNQPSGLEEVITLGDEEISGGTPAWTPKGRAAARRMGDAMRVRRVRMYIADWDEREFN
jgi:hypothetical protein